MYKEVITLEAIEFSVAVGYLLGILLIFVVAKIFFTPLKVIFKLILSSLLGVLFLILINLFSPVTGIYIGINAVTAVVLGVLGMPGTCLILLLQIFF